MDDAPRIDQPVKRYLVMVKSSRVPETSETQRQLGCIGGEAGAAAAESEVHCCASLPQQALVERPGRVRYPLTACKRLCIPAMYEYVVLGAAMQPVR